uniref:JmjC domain-containing protein n=1 Tax=Polytomella parva TaxID=51329 RepID=A0A7S0UNS9_9CHLO|mmetsp:Transcript_11157/g.20181  ORF Transcript_11157/g.20181 Transcript_11157/m.20181 type:complete len:573 (+) Transcript_11157:137-1855(+)|eukprot:CAMPEP_0175072658 /NCGR_PEP_ID=MMETSP0052_2-20121109/20045_1 /TAXON_ID=51329 ORGANISM="Polytomella parva, Strain SAG 63-3" /NCGR_SAMPLE_ID=MMETSP0052_2 /ASSEMBLY_ACC=CAM_ASM_000194 /LENGTH=572 /DNA_ID=CAMNT_0016340213 /DNA_START=51 /DNA_END=1769 /DNA_ORIENTATION=-
MVALNDYFPLQKCDSHCFDDVSRFRPQSDPLICGRVEARRLQKYELEINANTLSSPSPSPRGSYFQIERRHVDSFSYEEFWTQYLLLNKPVLIEGITKDWQAAKEWVDPETWGLNIDALERIAPVDAVVRVTETNGELASYGDCSTMPLREYTAWWRTHKAKGESLCSSASESSSRSQRNDKLLYLKDWHFIGECPHFKPYDTPIYFSSDWLNSYYDSLFQNRYDTSTTNADVACIDYRFLYVGPAGTKTPVHTDVLHSHSWSANVVGRKRWLMLAPADAHLVYDTATTLEIASSFGESEDEEEYEQEKENGRREGGNNKDIWSTTGNIGKKESLEGKSNSLLVALEVQEKKKKSRDERRKTFPLLPLARKKLYECIQPAGSALFVPSGWHHSVVNEEDTLSLNHNWINASNAEYTWALLKQQRADAAEGIDDLKSSCEPLEFESLVQRNVKANAGLDWDEWVRLLETIVTSTLVDEKMNGELVEEVQVIKDNDNIQIHTPIQISEQLSIAKLNFVVIRKILKEMFEEYEKIFMKGGGKLFPSFSETETLFKLPTTFASVMGLLNRVDAILK